MSTRNFQANDSYGVVFTTTTSAGALSNADSLPTAALYHNGVIDGAVTVTVANQTTGVYSASCTIPSGYAAGDRISLLVDATIGGTATGSIVDQARLLGYAANTGVNVTQWLGGTVATPNNSGVPKVDLVDINGGAATVSGAIAIDLTQAVPMTGNTGNTVGDCLNAARAGGFGKWVLSGTTFTLYGSDGTTVVRTFTVDSSVAPTQRV